MANTSTTQNKRRTLRVPYGKELVLQTSDGTVITGKAGDFSSTGFFVQTTGGTNPKKLIDQQAKLIVDLDIERLELPCKVLRWEKNRTRMGFGVVFL
ncbi:MAG: PilZ domain-containing protein [Magnetococcales bacterium]|nr:PilZ domain-containing protein [Magnetococcales bacterium]